MKSQNRSGINPKGQRVLVKVDSLEDSLGESAVFIPEEVMKNHQRAQMSGRLIEAGPDAWDDYKEAFADIGERVMFQQHAGLRAGGEDGEDYRVMNDVDIVSVISDNVFFDTLVRREALGAQGAGQ